MAISTLFKFKHDFNISVSKFIIIITLLNIAIYNIPLYQYTIQHLNNFSLNSTLTFISVSILLFIITSGILFFLSIVSIKLLKYFTILMVISNSIAFYFVTTYHVILDITMMGNLFNTNTAEATSYYSITIFGYLVFLGIIPALIIHVTNIQKQKRTKLFLYATGIIFGGILLMYLNSPTWLWLDKNAKIIGGLSMPWSYMINSIRYKVKQHDREKTYTLLPKATLSDDKKMIVVLVIGESARKENFSLYGYKKNTNPNLEKVKDLIVLPAKSTATYTTASVHSMLSYTGSTSDSYEVLPNYLHRMGIYTIWRSNNWGEPTLNVDKIEHLEDLKKYSHTQDGDYDERLLANLNQEIVSSQKNKVFVVLHTAGSHGPTYYKKYPEQFNVFKPVCKTVDLATCSPQELRNAYDNTILYTDYFLHKTIQTLKGIHDTPVLMLYISDHGESLGEYSLYLHGTPYAIAPKYQKEIPFLLWASESFFKAKRLNVADIKTQTLYGQSDIFHTILGAFGVNSSIYDKQHDILN